MMHAPAERVQSTTHTATSYQLGIGDGDEPAVRSGSSADFQQVKIALHQKFLKEIGQRDLLSANDRQIASAVAEFTERVLANEELLLNSEERRRLTEELTEETLGLGPLNSLMADPAVTDILVNGPDTIYIERFGRLELAKERFNNTEQLLRVIERIAARMGRRIDSTSPMVDLRLPDGSRVNATIPPVSIDGPTISIRRFGKRRLRRQDLLEFGTLSPEMLTFLDLAVQQRVNILISGGTGAGKSTLLGSLAEAIPDTERIITIEDTAELIFDQRHVVRMESRPANVEGAGRIQARDLVVNALRMRPDRIVVGEVRGGEALDMLQAMNTGHDGSMTTIHSNSTRDALSRLETLVLMAGLDLPSRAVREQICSALDLIVHVRRYEDGVRRIESIAELNGLESNTLLLQEIFAFRRKGRNGRMLEGHYSGTGIIPRFVTKWRDYGVDIPMEIFRPRS